MYVVFKLKMKQKLTSPKPSFCQLLKKKVVSFAHYTKLFIFDRIQFYHPMLRKEDLKDILKNALKDAFAVVDSD
jgi:hypothetical protein